MVHGRHATSSDPQFMDCPLQQCQYMGAVTTILGRSSNACVTESCEMRGMVSFAVAHVMYGAAGQLVDSKRGTRVSSTRSLLSAFLDPHHNFTYCTSLLLQYLPFTGPIMLPRGLRAPSSTPNDQVAWSIPFVCLHPLQRGMMYPRLVRYISGLAAR